MKPFLPLALLCSAICCLSCVQQVSGELPVIDLTKQYPQKDIVLQDIAYIPLNGDNMPLIGNARIAYFSSDCYILRDINSSDVFILENNGALRAKRTQINTYDYGMGKSA